MSLAPTVSILFVEDEPDIRHIVELALSQEADLVLKSFSCGFEALDHARSSAGTYDLALLNFLLPGMTGMDFARRMRAFPSTRQAKVALITANIPPGGVSTYEADGADAVILKPFEITQLAQRIRVVLQNPS